MNEKKRCIGGVFARAGARCERCGAHGESYHHRKKRSQGGLWEVVNIVLLCGSGTTGCHGWVEEHPNAAEDEGFHVRPWQKPENVGVLYRGQLAWLTEDGNVEYEIDQLESGDVSRRCEMPAQEEAG